MVRTAGAAIAPTAMVGFDPAITLLETRQSLSGYAHARPWATLRCRIVQHTDPSTNMMTVTQKGDPDELLDAAFRVLPAAGEAVRRLEALSAA